MTHESKITELCEIAYKYKTDKTKYPYVNRKLKVHCHNYSPYYYDLFNPIKHKKLNVLEIGIGIIDHSPSNPTVVSMKHMENLGYKTGGSLYMWRNFFPNAHIYAIDINPKAIFTSERITTYCCDQTDFNAMNTLFKELIFDVITSALCKQGF